jgi:hypothetical protein
MRPGGAASLLVAMTALGGCRQVLDVDGFTTKPSTDAGGASYVGTTDGYSYASKACRDCVDAECDRPAATCAADPGCAAQARCLARCGATDHECRGRCSVSTPSTTAMAELVACQAAHCGAALPEGARCGASLALHGNAACDQCLMGSPRCLTALTSLSRSAAALTYERCHDVCTCHGDCPEGAPGCTCDMDEATQALATSVATCCSTSACGQSEPDWSCVGHVESPPPPEPPPPLVLHMLVDQPDFVTPIPNLNVRACSALSAPSTGNGSQDCELSPPAVTGDDGWTTLTIDKPRIGDGYFSYLLLTANDSSTDAGTSTGTDAPALFYFFPPIRETPSWVVRRLVFRATADFILQAVPGVVADWEHRGGIVWSARSCNRAPEGLQLVSTSGLQVLYFDENLLVDNNATATSTAGIGFIPNAPPGKQDLEARLPGGELVGRYSVLVVTGALTHIVIDPTDVGAGK